MISTVKGMFGSFEGTLSADDDTLANAKLSFSGDVASITTRNAQRDGHLMSPDFFDAAQFPKVTFVSKSFTKKDEHTFEIMGDFTMKGISKELSVTAIFNGIATDVYGKRVAAFEISGTIKRTDYGVNWNAPLATGGLVVSEDVLLEATIEMKEE
jgi:polyisoprenoid-binding protein YceI